MAADRRGAHRRGAREPVAACGRRRGRRGPVEDATHATTALAYRPEPDPGATPRGAPRTDQEDPVTQLSQGERSLSTAAEAVVAARADVGRLQQQLAGEVAALGHRWAGTGAAAFHRVHQAWQERQDRVTGALDGFEAALRETETDTARTDDHQAEGFAHFAARLG